MSMPTIAIPLTYAEVSSLPPGERRDELTYLWRTRDEHRRRALAREDMDLDAIYEDADDCRRAALEKWHDTRKRQADRRALLRLAIKKETAA